jgi:hypothetical protein
MFFACVRNFAQRSTFLCCYDGQFQQVAFAGFNGFAEGFQSSLTFAFVAFGAQLV